MWAICKKELRQFFTSLTGYIAIIVFLLANGLMLFVFENNIFDFGYATLDRFFQLAPWILLLLIPAITMRSFADEFKTGTFEILQTRPLTRSQIVLGKYLANLIVVFIALAPTIIYIFSIQQLSSGEGIDIGSTIGSYIGLFFLAAVFTAIGICASSLTNNSVVAFIASLIGSVLLYYGFNAISKLPGLNNGVDYYIEMAGIDFHYHSISRGLIDTRDIVYFLSVIFLFISITNRNLLKDRMKNFLGKIPGAKFWWIFLLLILAGINFLASSFHTRFDLTKEKRYTLSKATKELLRNLNGDLSIDVFLKGDFPAGFKKLANSTSDFLELVKDHNSSKVRYHFISPKEEMPGTNGVKYGDSLVSLGASPINLTVQLKEGQQQEYIFPVALIHYKGKQRLVNLYSGSNRFISQNEINEAEALLEYQFVSALNKLVNDKKASVAYAIGNGEPVDARSYDLAQTLKQDYEFGMFNLQTQPRIPAEVNVLLIVKPSLQFSEDEKLKLDQYVMHGGKLLCFIDNLYAESDSLAFKPETIAYDRNLNLTDLFFRYGARINTDLVMDLQCESIPFVVGRNTSGQPQQEFLHWNYYPLFQPSGNNPIDRDLGLIGSRFVNSMDTINVPGVRKTVLLASSSSSRRIGTPALISLNENKNAPEDEKFKTADIPVAMLLEGKFTSLYRNRVSQAEIDTLASHNTPFLSSSVDNKMIVVADGDMVLNEFIPSQGAGSPLIPLPMGWNRYTYTEYEQQTEDGKYFIPVANRQFLQNCVEYLVANPAIIETRNKNIVLRLLDTPKVKEQKSMWQFINIALPVLLVILIGFIYQKIRKHRYT